MMRSSSFYPATSLLILSLLLATPTKAMEDESPVARAAAPTAPSSSVAAAASAAAQEGRASAAPMQASGGSRLGKRKSREDGNQDLPSQSDPLRQRMADGHPESGEARNSETTASSSAAAASSSAPAPAVAAAIAFSSTTPASVFVPPLVDEHTMQLAADAGGGRFSSAPAAAAAAVSFPSATLASGFVLPPVDEQIRRFAATATAVGARAEGERRYQEDLRMARMPVEPGANLYELGTLCWRVHESPYADEAVKHEMDFRCCKLDYMDSIGNDLDDYSDQIHNLDLFMRNGTRERIPAWDDQVILMKVLLIFQYKEHLRREEIDDWHECLPYSVILQKLTEGSQHPNIAALFREEARSLLNVVRQRVQEEGPAGAAQRQPWCAPEYFYSDAQEPAERNRNQLRESENEYYLKDERYLNFSPVEAATARAAVARPQQQQGAAAASSTSSAATGSSKGGAAAQ
jgi:hypothetical protein